ncbi:hypothetical protein TNCV_1460391 [Trichonephila clavipes]|nr:hypothetical protein TNCV_1460391 [Trichonephila clavipes]
MNSSLVPLEDPPCSGAMYVKSVEAQASSRWCGVEHYVEATTTHYGVDVKAHALADRMRLELFISPGRAEKSNGAEGDQNGPCNVKGLSRIKRLMVCGVRVYVVEFSQYRRATITLFVRKIISSVS